MIQPTFQGETIDCAASMSTRSRRAVAALLLAAHAALLAWIDWRAWPNALEAGHMVAGLYSWKTLQFDVYNVNPPLVRAVATAPVALCAPKYDWSLYSSLPADRSEWELGGAFLAANGGEKARRCFALARWSCIPFCLAGACACYFLSRRLYGDVSALFAMALWCFSPTVLAWGATMCPEVAAAGMGVAAICALRRWLLAACWPNALLAGVLLGILPLTKFTWIAAFALWPAIWVAWRWRARKSSTRVAQRTATFGQLAAVVVTAVFVVNLGYAFDGSLRPLGGYQFRSTALGGVPHHTRTEPKTGNRFATSWVGLLPVPFPADFVQGTDTQRYDFEDDLASYLHGEWANHGWWYFYLYALAIKEPVGMWCLVAIAVAASIFGRGYSAAWRDELLVLAPFAAIFVFVSSQTGLSMHVRYAVPALPFLFVWASKAARAFQMRPLTPGRAAVAMATAAAVTWSAASSLAIYPFSFSYFNELVGGPACGPRHLLGSNIDAGQDLLYLKDWLAARPDVRLDGLAICAACAATVAGMPDTPLPPISPRGPRPGWYALSVNHIYGPDRRYRYFLRFPPVTTIGYSIYVYHVTRHEAGRVRRELGLPELDGG